MYVKVSFILNFTLFRILIPIFIAYTGLHLFFPYRSSEAQYLMTSQIRSPIEYLIPTDNIPKPLVGLH